VTEDPKSSEGVTSAAQGPQTVPLVIDRIVAVIVWGALIISASCIAAIIGIGSWDTAGRLLDRPLLGAVEMTESLLAAVIFLAMPYAQRQYKHVVVDILYQTFRGKVLWVARMVALCATLAMFLFLYQQAMSGALHAYGVGEVSSGVVRVPIWLAKILSALGLLVAAIETFRQIVFVLIWPDFEARRHVQTQAETAESMEHM